MLPQASLLGKFFMEVHSREKAKLMLRMKLQTVVSVELNNMHIMTQRYKVSHNWAGSISTPLSYC